MILNGPPLDAATDAAKIMKVLPLYLDLQGRESLSPSLYERDAYQAVLRKRPAECSGLRFSVQWKAKAPTATELKLRLEVRISRGETTEASRFEQPVKVGRWFSTWSAITYAGEDFKKTGEVVAWRVSLWNGEQMMAEQRSFLW